MTTSTTSRREPAEDRPRPEPNAEVLEQVAFDLAHLAGEVIADSLRHDLVVHYKDEAHGIMAPADPVTEIDLRVERLLRAELARDFPDDAFVGEETAPAAPGGSRYTWVVDPVDGTQNFVNGVPVFGASVAALHDGVPVAGATWCSTTHALRPGIYHASVGSLVRFDGDPVGSLRARVRGVERRLSTTSVAAAPRVARWDHRRLGAATVECALVAVGALESAHLAHPRAWDVAAGVVLAQAAGCEAWTRVDGRWRHLQSFATPGAAHALALRQWSQPVLIARPGMLHFAAL